MERNAEALVAAQTDMPVSWSSVIPSSIPSLMAILAAGDPRRTAPPAIGPNDILAGLTSALPEPSGSRYVRWIAVTSVPGHRITAATIAGNAFPLFVCLRDGWKRKTGGTEAVMPRLFI